MKKNIKIKNKKIKIILIIFQNWTLIFSIENI